MKIHLINARKNNNLTQKQLGQIINKSKQTISSLEKGRIIGSVATWDALERILGVDQKILRQVDCSTNSQD